MSEPQFSDWDDVDLLTSWDVDTPPEVPSLLGLWDDIGAAYIGKLNTFLGEPESCKTWAALIACAEQMSQGYHVMWIDLEDTPETIKRRLKALGVTRDEAELFHYKRPESAPPIKPTADEIARACTETNTQRAEAEAVRIMAQAAPFEFMAAQASECSVVVIDSATELLSLYGLNGDVREEVSTLHKRLRSLFTNNGAGVILLDHVIKSAAGRGRWATGSERKIGGLEGTAITFEVDTPFGIGKTGRVKLSVSKDRPGSLRGALEDAKTIGSLVLTSNASTGAITWTVERPNFLADLQRVKPEWQAVINYLAEHPKTGLNQILRDMSTMGLYTGPKIRSAVNDLYARGDIAYEDGKNNSKLYYWVDPDIRCASVRTPPHTTRSSGVSVCVPNTHTPHTPEYWEINMDEVDWDEEAERLYEGDEAYS